MKMGQISAGGVGLAILLAASGAYADGAAQPQTYSVFQEKMRQQSYRSPQPYQPPAPQGAQIQAPIMAPVPQVRSTAPSISSMPAVQQNEAANSGPMTQPASANEPMPKRDAGHDPRVYQTYNNQDDGSFADINPVWGAVGTGLLIAIGLILVL